MTVVNMLLLVATVLVNFLALVAAQSSSTSYSIGYGPYGNASMTPNNGTCGECNIFFFPYLRVWNSTEPDESHDNFTVATASVTIYEDTGVTITNVVTVNTTATTIPCTGPQYGQICPLYSSGEAPGVATYSLDPAGPDGINITRVVTSPTAIIWWGAYSLQGAYPTTNAAGSTFCNSTTKVNGTAFVIVPFTSVTIYPYSDMPAAYTGTVDNPALSFEDIPFPTASAENFLAQFPNQNAFSYCTPLRYYGSPQYASPVAALTMTQTITTRQSKVSSSATSSTTSILAPTTAQRSSVATPTSSAAPIPPPPSTYIISTLSIATQIVATSPTASSSAVSITIASVLSSSEIVTRTTLQSLLVSSAKVVPPTAPSLSTVSIETYSALSTISSVTQPLGSGSATPLTTVTEITVIGGTVEGGSPLGGTTLTETTVIAEVSGSTALLTTATEITILGGTVVGGSLVGGTTLTETTVYAGAPGLASSTPSSNIGVPATELTTAIEVTVIGGTVVGGSTIGGTPLTETTVVEGVSGSATVLTTITEVTVVGGTVVGGSTIGGTTLTETTVYGGVSRSASPTGVPSESIVPFTGGGSSMIGDNLAVFVSIWGLIMILFF